MSGIAPAYPYHRSSPWDWSYKKRSSKLDPFLTRADDERDGEVGSRKVGGQAVWARRGAAFRPQGGSKCTFNGFVLGLGLLLDEQVERCKKPQLEADFGYQTVFNTWRGVCGIELQGT